MIARCRRFKSGWRAALLCLSLAAAAAGGCSSSAATLELITAARKGINMTRSDDAARHDEDIQRLAAQAASLDAAFDADVKLAAAGQIRDAEGKPLELSADWVISARKGYAAARDMLAEQSRMAEASHRQQQDNLAAADEALEMASQLTVWQSDLSERLKQHLLSVQRSLIHER